MQKLKRLINTWKTVEDAHENKKNSTYCVALKHRFLNKLLYVESQKGIACIEEALIEEREKRKNFQKEDGCSTVRDVIFGVAGAVIGYYTCDGFLEFLSVNVPAITKYLGCGMGGVGGVILSSTMLDKAQDIRKMMIKDIYGKESCIIFHQKDLDVFEEEEGESRK